MFLNEKIEMLNLPTLKYKYILITHFIGKISSQSAYKVYFVGTTLVSEDDYKRYH